MLAICVKVGNTYRQLKVKPVRHVLMDSRGLSSDKYFGCRSCPRGTYALQKSATCKPCEHGKFQKDERQSTCANALLATRAKQRKGTAVIHAL